VVQSIIKDRHGVLWFGTNHGLCSYDGLGWKVLHLYYHGDSLSPLGAEKVLEDRGGALWCTVPGGGVVRYDGASYRQYMPGDGLASFLTPRSSRTARGPCGWARPTRESPATTGPGGGPSRTADGLVSDEVLAICQDASGALWFGTRNDGISRYDGNAWRTYTTADG